MDANVYIQLTVRVSADKYSTYKDPTAKRELSFNIPVDAASDIDYTAIIRRMVAQAHLEWCEMPTPPADESE